MGGFEPRAATEQVTRHGHARALCNLLASTRWAFLFFLTNSPDNDVRIPPSLQQGQQELILIETPVLVLRALPQGLERANFAVNERNPPMVRIGPQIPEADP